MPESRPRRFRIDLPGDDHAASVTRVTFTWTTATAASALLLPLFGLARSPLLGLALAGLGAWLVLVAWRALRKPSPLGIGRAFRAINYYALLVMGAVMLDAVLGHEVDVASCRLGLLTVGRALGSRVRRASACRGEPRAGRKASALPRRVELHLGLWEPHSDGVLPDVPGDVLDRRRSVRWQGIQFPALADDDALLLQVLHAFKHMLSCWCRMSCFLEITYFMAQRHADTSFWNQFRSRLEDRKLLPEITGLVFAMATNLFVLPRTS